MFALRHFSLNQALLALVDVRFSIRYSGPRLTSYQLYAVDSAPQYPHSKAPSTAVYLVL